MAIRSIRGATTCINEKNAIHNAAKELLSEIIKRNNLNTENIISVFFTATNDLTTAYPAPAARELGITRAGIMCMQEQTVDGSLPHCLRCMLHIESDLPQGSLNHIYLRDAVCLRPDITGSAANGFFAVAIDGPAGSGKSTAARMLAKDMGFIYADTGAMYRAAALYCIENGADPGDEQMVKNLIDKVNIELKFNLDKQLIYLNGKDVTERIRMQDTAQGASKIAVHACVRDKMTELQREIAAHNNIVMDGRDIGTVVLPNANVKIYMDAAPSIRAKRRVYELEKQGVTDIDINAIEEEIKKRDERDMTRDIAPLKRHKDAVYIDTGEMTAKEAVCAIKEIVNKCYTAS